MVKIKFDRLTKDYAVMDGKNLVGYRSSIQEAIKLQAETQAKKGN